MSSVFARDNAVYEIPAGGTFADAVALYSHDLSPDDSVVWGRDVFSGGTVFIVQDATLTDYAIYHLDFANEVYTRVVQTPAVAGDLVVSWNGDIVIFGSVGWHRPTNRYYTVTFTGTPGEWVFYGNTLVQRDNDGHVHRLDTSAFGVTADGGTIDLTELAWSMPPECIDQNVYQYVGE